MEKVTAPYTFVPLSDKIFTPDWGGLVSQDAPFEDGICGTIEYEIEALGPIFVRGAEGGRDGAQRFFTTPDGTPAIPGSSIRGLLRNVIQIASFGRFGPINNHRYGFRDLQNRDLYGKHMATLAGSGKGSEALVPLVGSGWLVKGQDWDAFEQGSEADLAEVARIVPCSFAKVEYGLLRSLKPNFDPGRKQSAPDKYKSWGPLLDVKLSVKPPIGKALRPGLGDFTIAQDLRGTIAAKLVFTGQPSDYRKEQARKGAGQSKHHDFAFYGARDGESIPVSAQQFRDFEHIHSDRGQQNRTRAKPNAEWENLKRRFDAADGDVSPTDGAPIFYLLEEETAARRPLRSFGLAMMFRLAYRNSVSDVADDNQKRRRDGKRIDLAESLFGRVPDARDLDDVAELGALKGRVSVGLATLQGPPSFAPEVKAVLGAPKASFYPNYIEQAADPQALLRPGAQPEKLNERLFVWLTYEDDNSRLRGWKRYVPQKAIAAPALPEKASEKVISRFTPLTAGSLFKGKLRVHNLRPEEMGALVWALTFGGRVESCHMLGMARSLGYGRVQFRINGLKLVANKDPDVPLPLETIKSFQHSFQTRMSAWATEQKIYGGWEGSAQMTELLAASALSKEPLLHLSLYHPQDRNQFSLAKKNGLALGMVSNWRNPGASGTPPPPTEEDFPAFGPPPPPRVLPKLQVICPLLTFQPGTRKWSGDATCEGKQVKLSGEGLEATDAEKKKGLKNTLCEVEPAGGKAYKILRLVR